MGIWSDELESQVNSDITRAGFDPSDFEFAEEEIPRSKTPGLYGMFSCIIVTRLSTGLRIRYTLGGQDSTFPGRFILDLEGRILGVTWIRRLVRTFFGC